MHWSGRLAAASIGGARLFPGPAFLSSIGLQYWRAETVYDRGAIATISERFSRVGGARTGPGPRLLALIKCRERVLRKSEYSGIAFPIVRMEACGGGCAWRGKGFRAVRGLRSTTSEGEWKRAEFFYFFGGNPLKRLDSEKQKKAKERPFCFLLLSFNFFSDRPEFPPWLHLRGGKR